VTAARLRNLRMESRKSTDNAKGIAAGHCSYLTATNVTATARAVPSSLLPYSGKGDRAGLECSGCRSPPRALAAPQRPDVAQPFVLASFCARALAIAIGITASNAAL